MIESVELPLLDHLFQTAKTGADDEYGNIDETLASIILQRITRFVIQQH